MGQPSPQGEEYEETIELKGSEMQEIHKEILILPFSVTTIKWERVNVCRKWAKTQVETQYKKRKRRKETGIKNIAKDLVKIKLIS